MAKVPFLNKRYIKGIPFLPKSYIKCEGLDLGAAPSELNFVKYPPPGERETFGAQGTKP